MKTKERIHKLRLENKSYSQIAKELDIAKSTVSFHCKSMGLNKPINNKSIKLDDKLIKKIRKYYKTHTLIETGKKYNVGLSTIIKYCDSKITTEKLTDEQKRIKNYDRVKKFRINLKKKAVDYKGGVCEKCGYNKCVWALEFHHKNPNEKDFQISKYGYLAWSLIEKELDKCILVCANCHRELHYKNEYGDIDTV